MPASVEIINRTAAVVVVAYGVGGRTEKVLIDGFATVSLAVAKEDLDDRTWALCASSIVGIRSGDRVYVGQGRPDPLGRTPAGSTVPFEAIYPKLGPAFAPEIDLAEQLVVTAGEIFTLPTRYQRQGVAKVAVSWGVQKGHRALAGTIGAAQRRAGEVITCGPWTLTDPGEYKILIGYFEDGRATTRVVKLLVNAPNCVPDPVTDVAAVLQPGSLTDFTITWAPGSDCTTPPAPPVEQGRPSDDLGSGRCSWFADAAFDQQLVSPTDDVCISWSQFEGTSVVLQYATNRCDQASFINGDWGSGGSFGGDGYDSGGFVHFPGVKSSKVPGENVRLKLRFSDMTGPYEFELVAVGLGYYGGGLVASNRTIRGVAGVIFSHTIAQITDGDGFLRVHIDPATRTLRIRCWK